MKETGGGKELARRSVECYRGNMKRLENKPHEE